jgi:hypothetical protein
MHWRAMATLLRSDHGVAFSPTGEVMARDAALGEPFATLRCQGCGRVLPVTKAAVAAFEASGWPRCCGEVMPLGLSGKQGEPDGQ